MHRLVNTEKALNEGMLIYEYAIVGAGTSGMQTLQILTRKTPSIIVLQAQDYQGGRIQSQSIADIPQAMNLSWIKQNLTKYENVYIEKGATWIQYRHEYMLKLCKQLGLTLREQISKGFNFYLDNEKSYTQQQLMQHSQYGPALKLFINKIDYLAKLYNQKVLSSNDTNQNIKMLIQYDKKTVTEFLQQNIEDQKSRQLVENFLEHTECMNCDENSMHQVLAKHARSNDIGILKEFLGAFGHQPSYLIEGGTSILVQKFQEKIQGNMKKFNKNADDLYKYKHQVITIDNKRKDFCTIIACDNETNKIAKFRAKKVICTVPLAVTRTLTFTNISLAKKYIFDNQLRTSCSKSFLIVKKPFWWKFATGDGLFSYDYLVNMCHDISPTDGSCGILVFFHNGKKYIEWQSLTRGEQSQTQVRKKYLIDLVCKLFRVNDQKLKHQYFNECLYYESTFMTNPYIRSGFQSNTRPGTFRNIIRMKDSLQSFFRDQNNVYFIGSEYSKLYASYMEGAIRASRMKSFPLIGEKDPYAV